MRTPIDLGDSVIVALQGQQEREEEPLGRLNSDLFAQPLAAGPAEPADDPPFQWICRLVEQCLDPGNVDPSDHR